METPETRYVRRPDGVNIAYQVVGEGPFDLLVAPGFISHLELQWTEPSYSAFLQRLAVFSRLILYDKPGTGVSDPIPHVPSIEERMMDIGHVLDAAGADEAALFGVSEGGPASALFAATYPARVRALVLLGTWAKIDLSLPGSDVAMDALRDVVANWGDGSRLADLFGPSANGLQRRLYGTFARASASPAMASAVVEAIFESDVSAALDSITVPTLVLHRTGDRAVPVRAAKRLADAIPGAKFVEQPGDDHVPWMGDTEAVVAEIESFLTGARRASTPDRVLATVLFTDIVESTKRAAEMGDTAWRRLLERYEAVVAEHVSEFDGRVVKSLGDGTLATFDGPARAVRCARALCTAVGELGLDLRAGVHTGEVELLGEDLGGVAVHIGARVAAHGGPGEVIVSSTVKDLVIGSELFFADRGEHELKGVPGRWRIFELCDERRASVRRAPLPATDGHLTLADRFAVGMASRAPGAVRAVGKLAARRRVRTR